MTGLRSLQPVPVCTHERYVYIKHFRVAACVDCKREFIVSNERSERDQNHEWVHHDS